MYKSRKSLVLFAAAVGFSLFVLAGWSRSAEPTPTDEQRQEFLKQLKVGNFNDAYKGFRSLALAKADDPLQVAEDLKNGIECLSRLGRLDEIDDFREKAIAAHGDNWRLLQGAARSYLDVQHYGTMVAGKFYRGNQRGGGGWADASARDRVRALQLMQQALPLVAAEHVVPSPLRGREAGGEGAAQESEEKAEFYLEVSEAVLTGRGFNETWQLQILTDLSTLPDYSQTWNQPDRSRGAPVDAEGNPIFYRVPKSWADAANDGQRWRWALAQAEEASPKRRDAVRLSFADFLQSQFDVQTMAEFSYFGHRSESVPNDKDRNGPFSVHSLGEDETIARLATGFKRFKLPDEFNFIKIDQSIANDPKSPTAEWALDRLGVIFENRQQFPKAADYWRRDIKQYGPGSNSYRQNALNQIVGNWGRFGAGEIQPAGQGASVQFIYRNGRHVDFTARQIKIEKLLDDVKAYLKSHPQQLDWQKLNLQDIGYRLVTQNEDDYLGKKVADWGLDLDPPAEHFDREITVATPLQKAGPYLLTAKMADGNTSRIIVWLADTAIVKKPLSDGSLYIVADAVTGRPIPKMNVELFGYRQRYEQPSNTWHTDTKDFAEYSDDDGEVILAKKRAPQDFQWLAIARGDDGRLAYTGFSNIWYGELYDAQYNETKVFTITDRPVYRPGQTVKFKLWIRHAQYDNDKSEFGNREFTLQLFDPKTAKILEKTFTSDAYGGIEGRYELPSTATLGNYQFSVVGIGGWAGGNFRVEEYKKPEFEVTIDAPSEPVSLGERISATIKAKYYFGSPVTHARVKYKILRSSYTATWFPPGVWDWLYGPGYWWFGYDYLWYPGWNVWGCRRPIPFWWGYGSPQPEVVADGEAEIGNDGQLKVDIDTAAAKAVHPDDDERYEITAEVVDASRRTIVGTGTVLVAHKPFDVTTWLERGFYQTGDEIVAHFAGRTLDGKPVKGTGHLVLYSVSYPAATKAGKQPPVEKALEEWNVDTDAQGDARQTINAAEPGQYRLSYKLTDARGHTIEGGYVFTITGPDFTAGSFRFNDIELIPQQREYAPGDHVKLMVSTNRRDGIVWLFLRPSNGVYRRPKLLRLDGKSTVIDIGVTKRDMPNFFVEAVTISGGKAFDELKEIVVPPEQRILNVAVDPSRSEYKPDEKATVGIRLTDLAGKPFVGSTVVAVYDKAVEYISGGSNVPDIKSLYWNWRRTHNPQQETNLAMQFGNLLRSGETGMSELGVFGGIATGLGTMNLGAVSDGSGGGFFGGPSMTWKTREIGLALHNQESAYGANAVAFAERPEMVGAPLAPAATAASASTPAGAPAPVQQPTIRSNFADTALWVGSLTTDERGEAQVSLNMPENLTTWKIKVWGMGEGTRVGEGTAEVVTRKNIIVRLEAPRFFVEKDEVVLSANVHNYLKTKKSVQVVLELPDGHLAPMDQSGQPNGLIRDVEIPAGGEARVDWRVKVVGEGKTTVRMKALTDEESDAMEQSFPAYVHGMSKMEAFSGALRPSETVGKITFNVPAERRPADSVFELHYSPTLAGAMVDALPYLADYPYGCTEQTLNRFLPTVLTQKVLLRMGLDLKKIKDKRTNLNAQELGDSQARAAGWKRFERNPVFDNDEVTRMVKTGVERLQEMQMSDGGWGWFYGYGEISWPHTTATVVHGLQLAKANDVAIVPGVLERGIEWLTRYQDDQVERLHNALVKPKPVAPYKTEADNLDAFVYMVLVDGGVQNSAMRDFLYRDRVRLAVYAKALFGLGLEKQADQKDKLAMIMQNIRQYVVEDNEDQTAYLKLPEDNYWWMWYGSEIEADANYLKLLSRTAPKGELAPKLVKYLLNNRKNSTYWNSTRDTALAIEALADYLRASGEDRPDETVEIILDGKKQKEVRIKAEDLFTFDNRFVLRGDAITTGRHEVEVRKTGAGPLYYNAYLSTFTLEDWIGRAGLEVRVNRHVYKLVRDDQMVHVAGERGQAVGERVEHYKRVELKNDDVLTSGDLVEVELEIDSMNDYEYLMFEDMKAAGFEPVDLQSGYTANALGAYMELRDNRVTFFVHALPRGKHSVSYRLRAEIPGRFSALPARASAMYAPELRANSDEIKLSVRD